MRQLLLAIFLFMGLSLMAQESEDPYEWDNLLYVGNKVSWGGKKFKNSVELQFRLQNNMRNLQQYFIEYVGTWLINKNVEIAPDFRIAIRPHRTDFRPGLGVVLKHYSGKTSFVHQIKGQIDFESTGGSTQTIRYFPSINYSINEKWLISGVVGAYYKLSEQQNDFSAFIVGIGCAYIINDQHGINLSYLYAEQQNFVDDLWFPAGGIILRLIINVNKEYDHEPAKYINF